MPTCEICDTELSGTQSMKCTECGQIYCRDHYHGHDCDSDSADASPTQTTATTTTSSPSVFGVVAVVAYAVGLLFGALGLLYLAGSADLLISGADGIETLAALGRFAIAAALFSVGTYALVFGYILSDQNN
jgi:hypothetical protein